VREYLLRCLRAPLGCFLNEYSTDPNRRMQELLHQSEDLRQIRYEWERCWMIEQPSNMTFERIHGGVAPNDE
jgi:hypothetical protein